MSKVIIKEFQNNVFQFREDGYFVSALESASVFSEISSSHLKSITSSLDFHHDHSRTC